MEAKRCVPLGRAEADALFREGWRRVLPKTEEETVSATVAALSPAARAMERLPVGEEPPMTRPSSPSPAKNAADLPRTQFRPQQTQTELSAPAAAGVSPPAAVETPRPMAAEAAPSPAKSLTPQDETAQPAPAAPQIGEAASTALPPAAQTSPPPAVARVLPAEDIQLTEGQLETLLQELIRSELADWQSCRALGKRTGAAAAKVFSTLATESWQCAKRLSAAYFLTAGIRYWPEKQAGRSLPPYLTALRERYHAARRDTARYDAAALLCGDECLREVFTDCAAAKRRHARQIQLLAEQL